MTATRTPKLTVTYPMTPGNPNLRVAEFDDMASAQAYADEVADRRGDLKRQDIRINLGRDGRTIGYATCGR